MAQVKIYSTPSNLIRYRPLAGLGDNIDLTRMAYNEKLPILPRNRSDIFDKANLRSPQRRSGGPQSANGVISPIVGRANYRDANIVSGYTSARTSTLRMKAVFDRSAIEFTGAE
jgi:hypothetical protein